jgi:hypothetical protein
MQQHQLNQIHDCFLSQSTDRIVIESIDIRIVNWENNQNELKLSLIIGINRESDTINFIFQIKFKQHIHCKRIDNMVG